LAADEAHERDAIAVRRVHVRLHLEDERGEALVARLDDALAGLARARVRADAGEVLEEGLDAEARERAAEEDRRDLAGEEALPSPLVARALEEIERAAQLADLLVAEQRVGRGIVEAAHLQRRLGRVLRGALEREHALALAVVDALEEI